MCSCISGLHYIGIRAAAIDHLRRKVASRVHVLQNQFPGNKAQYLQTTEDIKALGITPDTTYLSIQGHSLFDNVVVPILTEVCKRLRQERQDEIMRTSCHHTQRRSEMACYEHSLQDIRRMLKRNTGSQVSQPFRRLRADLSAYRDASSATTDESDSPNPDIMQS